MLCTVDSWPFVCIVFAFVGWKGYGRHSMGKRYTRLNRLFQIITLVQGRRTLKREDLAALCEVHVRTISRDLATLNLSDFPCAFDEEAGGYKVARGLFMPPIDFRGCFITHRAASRRGFWTESRMRNEAYCSQIRRVPKTKSPFKRHKRRP